MALRLLMRTNDLGKLAVAQGILSSEGIYFNTGDWDYSFGAPGVNAVRLLVIDSVFERAKEILIEAGLKADVA